LCNSLKHIARIIINKRIERGPEDNSRWFISDDEVYLEFNATHAIDPSEDMFDINRVDKSRPSIIRTLAGKLRRVLRRWSAAWRLILGKEVYFCSDIILDHNHARKFSECLIEALDEMKDVGGRTLGTENNAL
jgi:hypothetical protein